MIVPCSVGPESVEQGLLLLVLRHYITRQYIKDVL